MAAIHDLLGDEVRMSILQELAETGASIGTIEAKLEMSPGKLKGWLDKGKVKPRSPYRHLYLKFRSFAAEARATAEAQQLTKAPTSWLERNSSARVVEDTGDSSQAPALLGQAASNIQHLNLGAEATLAALRILAGSQVDINQALIKGAVVVDVTEQPID
jgi:hypothetical protein